MGEERYERNAAGRDEREGEEETTKEGRPAGF